MDHIKKLAFEICKKILFEQIPEEFHQYAEQYMPDEKIKIISDTMLDELYDEFGYYFSGLYVCDF